MPVTAADAKDPAAKLRGSAVPWRRMLLHPAVWAIVINNYTFHYAFYVVMNWLPTYFEQVRPPAHENSLPWLCATPAFIQVGP